MVLINKKFGPNCQIIINYSVTLFGLKSEWFGLWGIQILVLTFCCWICLQEFTHRISTHGQAASSFLFSCSRTTAAKLVKLVKRPVHLHSLWQMFGACDILWSAQGKKSSNILPNAPCMVYLPITSHNFKIKCRLKTKSKHEILTNIICLFRTGDMLGWTKLRNTSTIGRWRFSPYPAYILMYLILIHWSINSCLVIPSSFNALNPMCYVNFKMFNVWISSCILEDLGDLAMWKVEMQGPSRGNWGKLGKSVRPFPPTPDFSA